MVIEYALAGPGAGQSMSVSNAAVPIVVTVNACRLKQERHGARRINGLDGISRIQHPRAAGTRMPGRQGYRGGTVCQIGLRQHLPQQTAETFAGKQSQPGGRVPEMLPAQACQGEFHFFRACLTGHAG